MSFRATRMRPWVFVLVVSLIGLGLRLLLLGHKSLWLDEVYGMRIAEEGLDALWTGRSMKYHPPLFYAVLRPWMVVAGTHAFILRLPWAILGALSLPLVYVVAAELFEVSSSANAGTARTSLWLAALSPVLIWYAQELRSYTLLLVLALLSIWAQIRLLARPVSVWGLLFVVATTVAFYTHYDAVLLLPLQGMLVVGLLAADRTSWFGVAAWLLGLGLAFMAYLPWLRTPGPRGFLKLLVTDQFYVAPLLERALGLQYSRALPFLVLGGVLALGLSVLALWVILRRYGTALNHLRTRRWVQILALLIFVVLTVLSVLPRGYTLKRHVLIPWVMALIGFGWIWPWRARYRWVLTVLLGVSLIASLINIALVPKPAWEDAVTMILSIQQPGDVVVLSPSYMQMPFNFYAQGRVPATGLPSSGDVDVRLAELAEQYDRIWWVAHTIDVGANRDAIWTWLNSHARCLSVAELYGVRIELYDL